MLCLHHGQIDFIQIEGFVGYFFRCFQGWEGKNCSQCVPMNGCIHGKCENQPNTCNCDSGWKGVLCDQPICK